MVFFLKIIKNKSVKINNPWARYLQYLLKGTWGLRKKKLNFLQSSSSLDFLLHPGPNLHFTFAPQKVTGLQNEGLFPPVMISCQLNTVYSHLKRESQWMDCPD